MGDFKAIDGSLTQNLGDMLEGAALLEKTKLELSKHLAAKERAEKEITRLTTAVSNLEAETKKLDTPTQLTDEEKIKLVSLGIKFSKDFPGDDWLIEYQPQ